MWKEGVVAQRNGPVSLTILDSMGVERRVHGDHVRTRRVSGTMKPMVQTEMHGDDVTPIGDSSTMAPFEPKEVQENEVSNQTTVEIPTPNEEEPKQQRQQRWEAQSREPRAELSKAEGPRRSLRNRKRPDRFESCWWRRM